MVIASRKSPLAKAQAEQVGHALSVLHPGIEIRYLWIESQGDQQTEGALAQAGGKGLFVRAIEEALLRSDADIAVHSMKDLPAAEDEQTPGLVIAAVPARADVRDCLVARPEHGSTTLEQLPAAAVLGTASPRRAAQALRVRPDLRVEVIRGNVQTRLDKVLVRKDFDATLMAVAGLTRAGLAQHAQHVMEESVMLPAACQGALAVQCRGDDHVTIWRCLPLNDSLSAEAVHAERAVVKELGGSCNSPICALAQPVPDAPTLTFRLRARVLSPDGRRVADADDMAPAKQMRRLIKRVLKTMREQGASDILRELV